MSTAAVLEKYDVIECEGAKYRILGIADRIVTIQMGIKKRVFRMFETGPQFDAEVLGERYRIIPKEPLHEIPAMSDVCQAAYDLNRNIISEIAEAYGDDSYAGLSSNGIKEAAVRIREKYSVSKWKLNRLITSWLQSGCSDYALLDHRAKGLRKANSPYQYTKRPGRKNKREQDTSTVILDDKVRALFDEIIRRKLSKKTGRFSTAFRDLVNERYSANLKLDDQYRIIKEDSKNTPTLRQFYYYLTKHSGVTEKDRYIAENSETEYRNNCRELTSDINFGVRGIGDRMEVDILDIDTILRAKGYRIAAGRPHLYLLVDIAARLIPAFYISYTNNSVTGLQGLLLNIGEDKVKLCLKYGIKINADEWPSNFLPGSLYCDNGSDFASNQIMEIFSRLGIERNLEPPAMGSMKGTIEHLFCQFYETHKDLLEEHGLILKRHDSKHYEQAALDMDDIIRIVILFIIAHNKQYMPSYPVTKEMLDADVECSPLGLYRYMRELYPVRVIQDAQQYQLDCMFEEKASVQRGDIVFKKHHYSRDPADTAFGHDFGESTKTFHLAVRYVRLSADFVMYSHNGRWYRAELNTQRSDEGSFRGLTRDQLEEYDDIKLSNDAFGERKNTKVLGDSRAEMKAAVKNAEKKTTEAEKVPPADKGQILQKEKQAVLTGAVPSLNLEKKENPEMPKPAPAIQVMEMSWDDAMEGLFT